MYECSSCSHLIDRSENSICHYKKNFFHAECCQFCFKLNLPSNQNSSAETPRPPKIDPKKGKLGPGKLSFNKLGNFEKNTDVNCKDCKKKIMGQRFLTHKLGEFRCKKCNDLLIDKCFMCKETLESKECFKDDKDNNYCGKCIKVYQEEKRNQEIEMKRAEDLAAKLARTSELKTTIHCDLCTTSLESKVYNLDEEILCDVPMICDSCNKIKLKQISCQYSASELFYIMCTKCSCLIGTVTLTLNFKNNVISQFKCLKC